MTRYAAVETQEWKASHEIVFKAPDTKIVYRVMLVPDANGNGPAYTQAEWANTATADWELVGGEWRFQGQKTPGGRHGSLTVRTLP